MRRVGIVVFLLTLATPALAQRDTIGVFFDWAAFEENAPRRCFAIAEPTRTPRTAEQRPFASIGFWPGRGARGQVYFRFSRAKREGSAVLLRIEDDVFQLLGGEREAWAPDPRADSAIVAAMRTGLQMTVETRSARGALMRDRYELRGAATAIDAAAIACARRG